MLGQRKTSMARLARMCDYSEGYLWKLLAGKAQPTATAQRRISAALKVCYACKRPL